MNQQKTMISPARISTCGTMMLESMCPWDPLNKQEHGRSLQVHYLANHSLNMEIWERAPTACQVKLGLQEYWHSGTWTFFNLVMIASGGTRDGSACQAFHLPLLPEAGLDRRGICSDVLYFSKWTSSFARTQWQNHVGPGPNWTLKSRIVQDYVL